MAGAVGTERSPVSVILLTIITIGIYGLYWQYATFKELKDYAGEGVGGAVGLILAIFIGIVNWFLLPSEVANLFKRDGQEPPVSGVTGFWLLLPLIGFIIWVIKIQGHLNEFWSSHEGAPAVQG